MPEKKPSPSRSRNMAAIGGKNTKPELFVRSLLHRKGFRFRLHDERLPGKPDIVLRKYSAVIFVNGCYWHGHNCHLFKWPKDNEFYWRNKIKNNQLRDAIICQNLIQHGWRVAEIWECALKGKSRRGTDFIQERISAWLNSSEIVLSIRGAGRD